MTFRTDSPQILEILKSAIRFVEGVIHMDYLGFSRWPRSDSNTGCLSLFISHKDFRRRCSTRHKFVLVTHLVVHGFGGNHRGAEDRSHHPELHRFSRLKRLSSQRRFVQTWAFVAQLVAHLERGSLQMRRRRFYELDDMKACFHGSLHQHSTGLMGNPNYFRIPRKKWPSENVIIDRGNYLRAYAAVEINYRDAMSSLLALKVLSEDWQAENSPVFIAHAITTLIGAPKGDSIAKFLP